MCAYLCRKAQDIASGLTYLHSKGVVHGDMKIVRSASDQRGILP